MKKWMVSLAVVAAVSLLAVPQLGADHHEQGGMEMSAEQKAEMEKWIQLGTPGEMHESMAMFAGSWDAAMKTWMAPGAPPMEGVGKSENTMILDGRYLVQKYTGEAMGMAMEGWSLMGYDNYTKKYVSVWIDNMSTMVMWMEGASEEGGNVTTMSGDMPNPMTGKDEKWRSVGTMVDEDTLVFEMFKPGPDGKEFKTMEITYTRAGDPAKKAGY